MKKHLDHRMREHHGHISDHLAAEKARHSHHMEHAKMIHEMGESKKKEKMEHKLRKREM